MGKKKLAEKGMPTDGKHTSKRWQIYVPGHLRANVEYICEAFGIKNKKDWVADAISRQLAMDLPKAERLMAEREKSRTPPT